MKNTLSKVFDRRHNEMVFIKENTKTTINDLVDKFGVSRSTINRDLDLFIKKNLIIKEYGSIVWIGHVFKEPNMHINQVEEKMYTMINSFLKNSSLVFINASPFSIPLIQQLIRMEIDVVTNSIPSAEISCDTVSFVGGKVAHTDNYSYFYGDTAIKTIKSFHPNFSLIYAPGIDNKLITTQTLEQSLVDRTMIQYSENNIIYSINGYHSLESNFMIIKRKNAQKIIKFK